MQILEIFEKKLRQKNYSTNTIKCYVSYVKMFLINQSTKDAYQFDFLHGLSDCDKWALVHEGRPSTMTWLYMTPR